MITITILCDNVVGLPFGTVGEHGFSALLERPGEAILFDTGCGLGIGNNLAALNKDIGNVKQILISHGHFDHTEGLPPVLKILKKATVRGHPGMFQPRISQRYLQGNRVTHFVGMPHRRDYLEGLGAVFHLNDGFTEVSRDIFLTGEIPRVTDFEKGADDLFLPQDGILIPDLIEDDQAVVIRTEKGLVILCGCAHAGLINTIRHARSMTGVDRIRAVLGGTHLMFLSENQLEKSIHDLKIIDPELVAVSHCTGMGPAGRLMREFGARFTFAHVGSVFQFD